MAMAAGFLGWSLKKKSSSVPLFDLRALRVFAVQLSFWQSFCAIRQNIGSRTRVASDSAKRGGRKSIFALGALAAIL
jgi:hypothetical protein